METLMHLVPLYPTLHRVLLSSLSNLALRHLNGCSPKPTAPRLLRAASGLYSILHYTGGKVGAANQWRKSMDDTLAFAWGALQGLRTTFPDIGSFRNVHSIVLHSEILCRAVQTVLATTTFRGSYVVYLSSPRPTEGRCHGSIRSYAVGPLRLVQF